LTGLLAVVDDPVRPTSGELAADGNAVRDNDAAKTVTDHLNEVVAHIHRAGLMIRTRCEAAESTLVEELEPVLDELSRAILQLQMVAFERSHPSSSEAVTR